MLRSHPSDTKIFLADVADWTKENGLQLNLSKTKTIMILGSSSKLKKLQTNGIIPQIFIDADLHFLT
ncbi:Protein of unknown function [Cotesia congregata]|uniref:Uncharacterized protein n=1 Tax=Cotesia congregata TaxID=51543 RepID=A0A8J2H815_COTCN|nr:Protein of unknown function [Cotesia congregata]